MTLERLREICLALPGTTEQIQWGADLVFKVGGKMFCVACTEVAPNVMSFKCDDESFAELCERDGIIPAPYLARAKWVALERWTTLEDRELEPLIAQAYALVKQHLPRKTQAALDAGVKTAPATTTRTPTARTKTARTKTAQVKTTRAKNARAKATRAHAKTAMKSAKAATIRRAKKKR